MKPYFTIGQDKKLFNIDCFLLLDWMLEIGLKIDLFLFSPPYNLGRERKRKDGLRKDGKYDACSHGSPDYPDNFPEAVWRAQQIEVMKRCSLLLSPNGSISYNMKPKRVIDSLSGDKVEQSTDEWLVPALKLSGVLFKQGKMILVRGSPVPPNSVIVTGFTKKQLIKGSPVPSSSIKDMPKCSIIGISTHNKEPSLLCPVYEEATIFKVPGFNPYYNNKISEIFATTNNVVPFPPIHTKDPNRHSAPFSLHFAREQILRWCPPGGLVCDPYSGGGTTMLACCYEKRGFIGSELIKGNCKKSRERILKEINDIKKNYNTIKTY
jgi:DNA modification methylase